MLPQSNRLSQQRLDIRQNPNSDSNSGSHDSSTNQLVNNLPQLQKLNSDSDKSTELLMSKSFIEKPNVDKGG